MKKTLLTAVLAVSTLFLAGCFHATAPKPCTDCGHADGSHTHSYVPPHTHDYVPHDHPHDHDLSALHAKLAKLKAKVKALKDHTHDPDPAVAALRADLEALKAKVLAHGHPADPEVAKLRADLDALTDVVTTHGHSAKTKVGPPVVPAETH